MLKELIYTGLGVANILKEKVESEIKKLEDEGKIKKDDAKSFLESLENRGKEEDEKIKNHIKSSLREIIDELGLATKDDILKLKEELKK
jgi:polyhydroxyalkanoate synthesis regulator phasin